MIGVIISAARGCGLEGEAEAAAARDHGQTRLFARSPSRRVPGAGAPRVCSMSTDVAGCDGHHGGGRRTAGPFPGRGCLGWRDGRGPLRARLPAPTKSSCPAGPGTRRPAGPDPLGAARPWGGRSPCPLRGLVQPHGPASPSPESRGQRLHPDRLMLPFGRQPPHTCPPSPGKHGSHHPCALAPFQNVTQGSHGHSRLRALQLPAHGRLQTRHLSADEPGNGQYATWPGPDRGLRAAGRVAQHLWGA